MTTSDAPLIVLTAGGTGGHVFPAEALAAELLARGYRLAFITDRRGHAYGGTLGQIDTHRIRAGGLMGGGLGAKLRSLAELAVGTVQAYRILRRLKPAAVVGFGGYPSVPATLAATRMGIPTLLHEQNAILGRANRLLAARVDRIATSFGAIEGVAAADRGKIVLTGNPVRPAIRSRRDHPYKEPVTDEPFRILVLGGSQGARVFSAVVPAALALLPEAQRRRLRVSQQARPEDVEAARAGYAAADVQAEVESFFQDVPERLAACHLLIARAGASTTAELTVIGRPAILVPYPSAADDHQTANARAVDERGGAWLMPQDAFTPEALAARLESFMSLPATLARAAAAAHAAGRPDAAARLADAVAELIPAGQSRPRPVAGSTVLRDIAA